MEADLRSRGFVIRTLDPADENWSDLEALAPILASAKVIAVGESAHHTREFPLLKHRLLRFSVAELGVTAFAMESGYPEGLSVSRWLAGGDDDLDALLERGFTNGFGNSVEMRDQLLWMREQGVGYYGVDVPGTGWSAEAAIGEIGRRDTGAAELLRHGLAGITPASGASIDAERHASLVTMLNDIGNTLSTDDGSGEAARLVAGLVAYVDMAATPGTFDHRRDEAMADAVSWVAEREPRILLGAANPHVQRVDYPMRAAPLHVFGARLSEQLGSRYLAIGTTFGRGSTTSVSGVTADFPPGAVGSPPAIDHLLASAGVPLFAIQTAILDDGPETRAMREFQDVLHLDVRRAFDLLIHVEEFGPATPPRPA